MYDDSQPRDIIAGLPEDDESDLNVDAISPGQPLSVLLDDSEVLSRDKDPSLQRSSSTSTSKHAKSRSSANEMPTVRLPSVIGTESNGLQAIALPDGSVAYLSQAEPGKEKEEKIQLQDGSQAVVRQMTLTKDMVQTSPRILEGHTVRLPDGLTAFIPANPNESVQGLHHIQLGDGTTAYLTSSPIGADEILGTPPGGLDAGPIPLDLISADQLENEPAGSKTLITTDDVPATNSAIGSSMASLGSLAKFSLASLGLQEKGFRCNVADCNRYYSTQHHLKVHLRTHTGDRPFVCAYDGCPRKFSTSYALKSHTRVHTGEKPYRCTEDSCEKAFKTSGDLQKHVRTHTGERPFSCPFQGCGRSFTTSNIRKVHIRTHTGERPYMCDKPDCKKTFSSATNYKNHMRIHTGEKPYVCTVDGCGKRFTEYSSLYKHHVVHTHSKPYVCNTCGKTYRQTSTLAMHKRTGHGEEMTEGQEVTISQSLPPGFTIDGTVLRSTASVASNLLNDVAELDDEDAALVINTAVESKAVNDATVKDKPHLLPETVKICNNQITLQGAQTVTVQPIPVGPGSTGQGKLQHLFVLTDPAQIQAIQALIQPATTSTVTNITDSN